MIPTLLSSELIDLARNKAAVLQAGARIIPMANRTVDVAKWSGDPTVAWRAEGATIPASDATIGKVTLSAKSLAGLTIVSRELLEDAAEVDSQLKEAFAAQVALAIDSAALYGSGAANTPLGVKLTSGILTAAFGGANGATVANTTAWNIVADAKGTLADNNELANGVIWAPRTARQFGKLQDSTFQPLEAPEYVSDLPRFATNQIPVALTVGTSSDCSDVFVADWSQLYVGVRTGLMVSVLTERYADTGQVGIVVWTRADLVVARAKAFSVTSGLRA
jgi:HK97 family phage major capsid protein